jgi:hypothetical protein
MTTPKHRLPNMLVACVVLAAASCAPSESELQATAAQADVWAHGTQTAQAPTPTPTATLTPTPSATPTPTSTPAPPPDPKAMIAWKDLGLPSSYASVSPEVIGIEAGQPAITGPNLTTTIEGSFAFVVPGTRQRILGYAFLLPTRSDQEFFDQLLGSRHSDFVTAVSGFPELALKGIANLPEPIGETSVAASLTYREGGKLWAWDRASFRIADVGATVHSRYPADVQLPIAIDRLATVYAESLKARLQSCRLVSVQPDTRSPFPWFEFTAEGFYPGERRLISLEGPFTIGGQTTSIVSMKAGLSEDAATADSEGRIVDNITLAAAGQDVSYGEEFTLHIKGYNSGCEIEQIVKWLGH